MRRDRKPWRHDPKLCRSLAHYQHNPHLVPAGKMVRIWSSEHGAYWRPHSKGYTTEMAEAGRWLIQDAFAETRHCGPEKRIWFIDILPGDTGAEARAERHWHEDMGNVLWWKFPIAEAPWVGTPLDSHWPGYHTHFTPLPPMPHKPKRGSANA